ncbi:non-ribosomal peptide synthetase [Streptosporangium amethystogenes]|uniref:non-ribosomal peptide synthetase n=1 Tax=Streptosporangium amethystogenes TaxID=2002 RepID=UPI0004C6FC50|nr:non-ribosomal peptide synthetase [Streptosporangium amethystogenes]
MNEPLTPEEATLWRHQRRHPLSAIYNICVALEIQGSVAVPSLRTAVAALADRHRLLRSAVRDDDGRLEWEDVTSEGLRVIRADAASPHAWTQEAAEVRQEARRPFFPGEALHRAVYWDLGPAGGVLQLTFHHCVCDGLSVRLAVEEIIRGYQGLAAAERPVLPYRPLVTPEEAARFWTPRLALAGAGSPLGTGEPAASGEGVLLRRVCAVDLRQVAVPRARDLGVSMFALTMSGVAAALSRWDGDSRAVAVGVPFSHRTPAEDAQIGYRVRTLPARLEIEPEDTLRSLAARVGRELQDAAMHADWGIRAGDGAGVGGESVVVVNLLQPAGMVGHHRPPPIEAGGLRWRPRLLHNGTAKFAMNVYVAARDGRLALTFECRAPGGRRTELEWFADLAAATVTDVFTLPADRPVALAGRGAPTAPPARTPPAQTPAAASLRWAGGGLRAVAERHPDAPAVVEDRPRGARRVTYRELAEASERMAARLSSAGIDAGQVVAVRLPRGAPLIAVVHGVLDAGGVLLPLDPELPPARARYMLSDSRARLLVEEGSTTEPGDLAVLGQPLRVSVADPAAGPFSPTRSKDAPRAAYVMYTSGSTGRPKGVVVGHDGLANRLAWMQRAFPLGPGHVVLAKTPLSFDVCLWELLWPPATGATVVTAAHGRHGDAGYLCDAVERYGVTTAHFVPAMLGTFLDVAGHRPLPSLRQVFTSGERLSRALAERTHTRLGVRVHNLYGPTEASIDVTRWTFDPVDRRPFVPIGRPIDNLGVRLQDRAGREVPLGAVGEIVVEGVGVGLGYLGDAAGDGGRFGVRADTGDRFYRTGDLARWRADGVLEFLGRLDDQVKINGRRVELEEIDAVLGEHPGVMAAGVLHRENVTGPARLQAFLVPHDDGTADAMTAEDLRAHAAERLPRVMVPTLFTVVDRLPYAASGKLARAALGELTGRDLPWPGPGVGAAGPAKPGEPGEPPERVAAHAAVCELLGQAEIPADVDLFYLGVDSINAVRLVALLRRSGFAVEVADIYEARTLRALADRLKPGREDRPGEEEAPGPVPDELRRGRRVQRRFPLSHLQTGLVYHRQVSDDYLTYVTSYELDGTVDADLLRTAIAGAALRHEAVRTAFDLTADAGPEQVVLDQVETGLIEHDLLGEAEPDAALTRWRDEVRGRPFAWDAPPLFAFHLHRLAPGRAVFSIVEPFLDGWSVAVLGRDILDGYERARSARDGHPLPPTVREPVPSIPSYASFVAAERAAARDEAALSHWRAVVDSPDVSWRLAVGAGEPGTSATWHRHDHVFGEEELRALRAAADAARVSLRTLVWAVHMRTVALFTGRRRSGSTLMVNGRPELAGAEAMCGLFLNMLPVTVDLGEDTTWRELVDRLVAAEQHSWRHRRTPYAVLRSLAPGFEPSTVFNYTEFRPYRDLIEDTGRSLRVRSVTALDQTYMDLTVQCSLDAAGRRLRLSVEHRAPAVTVADARRFLACLVHAARTAARDLDSPVHADPLPAGELARLAEVGHGPARTWPAELSLARVVDDHAAIRPRAVAVEDDVESFGYAELAALSRHYARGVHRLSSARHPVVGVLAPRSARSWAAVLAIWRAGGTYVPLSARLPAERMARIVEQAGVEMVFTDPRHREVASALPRGVPLLPLEGLPSGEVPAQPPRASAECAYLLFTSGSTGRPKGARIGTVAMVNHWWSKVELLGLDENCVVAQSAPASFDVSVWQFAVPWLRGGRVVVMDDDLLLEPGRLFGALDERGIRVYETTPSHLATLLDAAEAAGLSWPRPGSGLECMMVNGEAAGADLCRRWLRAGGAPLVNAYGPTECADDITHMVIDDPGITGNVPIGRPIPNIVCEVTDESGHPVPLGVEGELRVRGACLGLGYLDADDEPRRFLRADTAPHPVVAYRTGDRVRFTERGTLLWLGRDDGQVKVRGRRIELGDVETHLRAHPEVRDAAATVVRSGGGRLRAVVVARSDPPRADRRALLDHLAARVPSWMLPDEIVFAPALPSTAHGKLDRRLLAEARYAPAASAAHDAVASVAVAPSELDAVVAQEWQRITGRSPDPDSDFYAEGGSSLDSVRLTSRVGARLGRALSVTDLLRAPRYHDLIAHLREPDEADPAGSDPAG